jgi:hypothetical protein
MDSESEQSVVHGFDFKALQNRFPHLSVELDAFRKVLLSDMDSVPTIKPMKSYELKGMVFKFTV